MSKYNPLSERLAAHEGEAWNASFSELESVLGFPLPKAARTGRTWWGNDPDKSHSRAWAAHGWEVGDVDHAAERVVFRRGAASGVALVEAAGLKPLAPANQPPPVGPLHEPEPSRAPSMASDEVQPEAMRQAAETASAQMHATRALGMTAMITAGVAAVAGLGAVIVRGVMRRGKR